MYLVLSNVATLPLLCLYALKQCEIDINLLAFNISLKPTFHDEYCENYNSTLIACSDTSLANMAYEYIRSFL